MAENKAKNSSMGYWSTPSFKNLFNVFFFLKNILNKSCKSNKHHIAIFGTHYTYITYNVI